MVIKLKRNVEERKVKQLQEELVRQGFELYIADRNPIHIIGVIGSISSNLEKEVESMDIVDEVKRVKEAYKKANKKMHPENTIIDVCGNKIGGGFFQVIAGPCSVETKEQMLEVAADVKKSGAGLLRGGAFKPRTSPYSFQGLHENGLELLMNAGRENGLPVVTEIMDTAHIDLFQEVDVIQVGARNMQNFELLKELGKLKKPILLKRGLANTLEEFVMSAEYIMAGGNHNVILCERGIRTFETSMRNTLDISAIPMLKRMTHLPVIVDPSHAAGIRWMVEPLAMAAVGVGADGLMIEVHNNPEQALCDGAQSLTPEMFDELMMKIGKTVTFFGDL